MRLRARRRRRVAVYDLENEEGTPIYVHAKVCIVDDVWMTVGSDNLNRRSWTHDSEICCGVIDQQGALARDTRLRLAREHLGDADVADELLVDPARWFDTLLAAAVSLDTWHERGEQGDRPPGHLRLHPRDRISPRARPCSSTYSMPGSSTPTGVPVGYGARTGTERGDSTSRRSRRSESQFRAWTAAWGAAPQAHDQGRFRGLLVQHDLRVRPGLVPRRGEDTTSAVPSGRNRTSRRSEWGRCHETTLVVSFVASGPIPRRAVMEACAGIGPVLVDGSDAVFVPTTQCGYA